MENSFMERTAVERLSINCLIKSKHFIRFRLNSYNLYQKPKNLQMNLFTRLFLLFLFLGFVLTDLLNQGCNNINDCPYSVVVCQENNQKCRECSSTEQCISQHSKRQTCTKLYGYDICVQCSTDADCTGGKKCVTAGFTHLCASTCSSSTDNCAGSQCIYIGGQFYCLACENDADCKSWSGNSNSVCTGGVCSPVFLSCGQDDHCPTPTAARCDSNVCKPCNNHAQCYHLSTTPVCKDPGASGTCVQCIVDANCSTVAFPRCLSNTCVACNDNSQCTRFATTPLCSSSSGGTCVQCVNDSDCPSSTLPQCSSNTCNSCTTNSHCTRFSDKPVCSAPLGGICVQCATDSDCPTPELAKCSSNTCVACTDSTSCEHFPTKPVCHPSGGMCVQCNTNPDCPSLTAADCDSSTNTCIPCTISETQCGRFPSTPLCKNPGSSGVCVQCVNDEHCPTPAAARCEDDICTTCTADSQCNSRSWSKPFCSGGACVECLSINDCTDGKICSSGVCTSCTNSIQCTNPAASVCSPLGKCVECVNHSGCPDAEKAKCLSNTCVPCTDSTSCDRFPITKLCSTSLGGRCVECDADSDCSDPEQAECDTNTNTCIACTDSIHCAHLAPEKVCKLSGLCVECVNDSDCPDTAKAKCSSNACVPCTDSTSCDHFPTTKLCSSPLGGTCVECLEDSDCSNTALAKCSSNTCAACTEDSHCSKFPMTPMCSEPLLGGTCVQCVSDANCPTTAAARCASNTCAPCNASSQCTHLSSTPVCKTPTGSCVECLSDSDCTTDPSKSHCITLLNTCVSPCVPNCLQCLNSTACQVCLPGYYLLNSTCVTTCPSEYWQNDPTQTCELCDPTCQTCSGSATVCTSCFPPYVLDGSKCLTPPGISPPTVTLKSSSDPQTFLLVFSNPMAVTSEILTQTLKFSLTGMIFPTDYYLLNVTKQPDSKTFKIIFNFTKSVGIETLTVTFKNQKAVVDEDGLVVTQESVNAQTVRFTFFTEGEKAAAESLTSVGSSVSNAALSSSVGMFVAGGSGGIMWAFLGLFQIVNYLLFLNVNYPYNVVTFFKLFSTSSLNGIVPNPMEYLFPSIWEEMEAGLPSPPKFADNEMDALYLNNAGQTVVAWVAVGTLYILAKTILFLFRTTGRFNRLITNFKEKFEWGLVYNAFIGTYPELIIASCLQFVNMDFTTPLRRFSSVAALVIGALCFCAPFAVTYALESSAEVLGSQLHEKKHGALYEPFIIQTPKNAKVSPETAYYRRNFMAFIFLRKLVYFSGIVFAYDIPILQMLITCCSGLALLISMIKVKPFRTKRDAWMNIGTEVFMVMIHIVIFVFAGDDITLKLTDTQRKNVGWAVIFLCCAMVAYNAIFIFVQQVLALWSFGQLVMHTICKKKKEKTKNKLNNNYNIQTESRRTLNKRVRSARSQIVINNNFIQERDPSIRTARPIHRRKPQNPPQSRNYSIRLKSQSPLRA